MILGEPVFKMPLLGTKFASKIDQTSIQKGIETKMQVGLAFGPLLGTISDGFWCKFGGQVGSKLGQNRGLKAMSTKMIQNVLCKKKNGHAGLASQGGSLH